jgi:hypothetical protein
MIASCLQLDSFRTWEFPRNPYMCLYIKSELMCMSLNRICKFRLPSQLSEKVPRNVGVHMPMYPLALWVCHAEAVLITTMRGTE